MVDIFTVQDCAFEALIGVVDDFVNLLWKAVGEKNLARLKVNNPEVIIQPVQYWRLQSNYLTTVC